MPNPEDIIVAGVEFALQDLTDEELAQLHLGVTWQDGKSREHCQNRPWFPKVEHLFTEAERQEVHGATREAIGRVASLRLSR